MSRKLFLSLCGLFFFVGLALAQDAVPPTHAPPPTGDTFPATLGYAGLALATTVWGTMTMVVNHLWKRSSQQELTHAAAVAVKDKELSDVQEKRRTESEKLLREQKDIFAEVMVTTSKIGQTFEVNQAAIVRLTTLVEHLAQLVESWSEHEES